MQLNRTVILFVLIGITGASVGISGEDVVDDGVSIPRDIADSCPLQPTREMDDFYMDLITSATYVDSVRLELIQDECFAILSRKFERKLDR